MRKYHLHRGSVRHDRLSKAVTVYFSYACNEPYGGEQPLLRKPEKYASWKLGMNEYREHDRKVREYVAANS